MTSSTLLGPSAEDQRVVEELLRALVKGQRALQMYLPNNPMYQRAIESITEAFNPVWSITGRLVLEIEDTAILWDGVTVYRQSSKQDSFSSQLYKDGLRHLTLLPGVETEEITRLIDVINRARRLSANAGDDLLTLLWEQEFVLISYAFVEMGGEGNAPWLEQGRGGWGSGGSGTGRGGGSGAGGGGGGGGGGDAGAEGGEVGGRFRGGFAGPEAVAADVRGQVSMGGDGGGEPGPGAPAGLVNLNDYDSTLQFLDDSEHREVHNDLADEYRRDIRLAAIDALLDILELQAEASIRLEAIGLLEEILPSQLSTGAFRNVAYILRELRLIAARAAAIDDSTRQALLSFEDRLSAPDILDQLVRTLEESARRPSEEDVSEVLRELKPVALPTLLSHLGRSLDPSLRRLLEPSVEQLARTAPQLLAQVLDAGPPAAVEPALLIAARLRLGQLAPQVAVHLRDGTPGDRLAAVRAMGAFGTPTAVTALEAGLDDPERPVRQAALELLLARGGSSGTLKRLEAMIWGAPRDWERTERRMLFEAWAQLQGDSAVDRLREVLEPKGIFKRRQPPDVRACALFALAKVHSLDARLLVDRFTNDPEPVVRSAANTVLRDWVG